MRYNLLVEAALKGVVRQALERAAAEGLPGEHHFYLTFRTDDPETEISEVLAGQYPEEMTIVLQHQFWGLEVSEDRFRVTLTFNKMPETLEVPFRALTGFFDPSVQFGLQFQGGGEGGEKTRATVSTGPPPARPEDLAPPRPEPSSESEPSSEPSSEPESEPESETAEDGANVVTLDQFRKK